MSRKTTGRAVRSKDASVTGSPASAGRFVLRATVIHVVTYFVIGIIAALAIDYASLFEEPVIRDYMRPFGSVSLFIGPIVQIVRGIIVGVVLLPFRAAIAGRFGWLWLWLLLVGIGIFSTYAAAPSSIEGIVYTKLPPWYHVIGLPEMLVQSLLFSTLLALYLRHPNGVIAALPPIYTRILRAIMVTSLAFIGYALVSVAFALLSGVAVDPSENLTFKVQGLFLLPFLINGVIAFFAQRIDANAKRALIAGLFSYILGAAAILGYQAIVTGAGNPLYGLVAPILPAIIVAIFLRGTRPRHNARSTQAEDTQPKP